VLWTLLPLLALLLLVVVVQRGRRKQEMTCGSVVAGHGGTLSSSRKGEGEFGKFQASVNLVIHEN
jgi:hypothetical protein